MQARGPRWLPGVNGSNFFCSPTRRWTTLRGHQDHLIQQSCMQQASTVNQEVPADSIGAGIAELQPQLRPELQLEESLKQPTVPVQSPTKGQRNIRTRTR